MDSAPDTIVVSTAVEPTGCNPLINGHNLFGSITTPGEVDECTFEADAGDAIALRMGELAPFTEFQPWIRLFAPDGTRIGHSFGATVAQITTAAPATGTYTVLVATWDIDAMSDYRLTLVKIPGDFVVPPDDEGGPLTNGDNHQGSIELGDLDAWSFEANEGETIALSIGELAPLTEFQPWIRLFAPDGTRIGHSFGATVAQITTSAPETGTYTVLVATWDVDATSDYRLTLVKIPGAFVVPAGDEGGPLASAAPRTGTIEVGDLDVWSFEANQGDAIAVSIGELAPFTEFQPWIRLFAPDGTRIGHSVGATAAQINTTAATTGTYTVLVATWDRDATSDYRLTLNLVGP